MVPIRAVHREAAREGNSMIGLVLVTHGRLAVEFRSALEHVGRSAASDRGGSRLGPDDDVEQCRKDIIEAGPARRYRRRCRHPHRQCSAAPPPISRSR